MNEGEFESQLFLVNLNKVMLYFPNFSPNGTGQGKLGLRGITPSKYSLVFKLPVGVCDHLVHLAFLFFHFLFFFSFFFSLDVYGISH